MTASHAIGARRRAPTPLLTGIIKRDGHEEPFDAGKITAAIAAAGRAAGEIDERQARALTLKVLTVACTLFSSAAGPTVEGIQDIVEEVLLASPFKATAKAYILYREQHARLRELRAAGDLALVDTYLDRADWKVQENSNMAYSLQGLNNYISSEVSKVYWLNKIYPPAVREAHLSGDLHLHDLNLLAVYCVGWDLAALLTHGFRGAPGKAESGPARHLRSALGQIVNFFYTLQGEAAGAQAFSNFDTLLAPFVRWDGLSFDAVKQALRGFVFNLNVPTRVGFQTPFTNLTLDLKVPRHLAHQPAIRGGVPQDETFGEFQEEVALIDTALFEVLAEGDAKGRVFTFPIPTINIGPDFDWQTPDLDAVWQSTARYGIPYFANFVNSALSPDDARSMCCRLRLDLRKLDHRGGGLFGANPLTGSIGVVTVNLPRIGCVEETVEGFMARLDQVMDIARDSLEIKRKVLEQLTDRNLYPYTQFYLGDVKARFGCYWQNHFSTIGLVGMNEACVNLLGEGIGTRRGRGFALDVLGRMRHRLARFQEKTGHLYNLEATPAEGAGYRLARLDKARFPNAAFAGADPVAPPAYTNSSQLPVDYTDDPFEVLDLQDDLQAQYTGGTVLHFFTGEAETDPGSLKAFVRAVCHRYRLPYFTITPTFSVCPTHGYVSGEHPSCPRCDASCEVYSRVVGYLRPVSQWNESKADEFSRRSLFKLRQE